MKKILIFAAAAVVLGFASCGKKSAPAEEVADSIVVDTVYMYLDDSTAVETVDTATVCLD
jgi:RNA 3'-terminal phosphate cyclase